MRTARALPASRARNRAPWSSDGSADLGAILVGSTTSSNARRFVDGSHPYEPAVDEIDATRGSRVSSSGVLDGQQWFGKSASFGRSAPSMQFRDRRESGVIFHLLGKAGLVVRCGNGTIARLTVPVVLKEAPNPGVFAVPSV